jgi:hypothetical protein
LIRSTFPQTSKEIVVTKSEIPQRNDVTTPERLSNPGAGHQLLHVFVGTWTAEGQQYEGPIGPAASISALETYDWLTGEAFLVHRFEGRVGDGEAACIEIIASDAEALPPHRPSTSIARQAIELTGARRCRRRR